MIAPARVAAYQILRAVSAGTADLPAAIHSTRDRLPDERDQALAAEIATGVQRWRAALDHLIVEFSRRPIDRLDPEVVDILRLTAYQLTHLTRVPASASVDDGVELTKRAGKRSAWERRRKGCRSRSSRWPASRWRSTPSDVSSAPASVA